VKYFQLIGCQGASVIEQFRDPAIEPEAAMIGRIACVNFISPAPGNFPTPLLPVLIQSKHCHETAMLN
jgi:hypothetical protein